jgi:hypothetical protein
MTALRFNRPPVFVFPLREWVGVALPKMAVRISCALAAGCVEAYSAAAPVTTRNVRTGH